MKQLPWNRPSKYDPAIEQCLLELETYGPNTVEYDSALINLGKLQTLKAAERPRFTVSGDALVNAAAKLGVVLIVVMYEQHHAMTSRAKDWAK